MIVFVITVIVCGIVEGVIWLCWGHRRKRRERMARKSLYRLLEERVLSATLCNKITNEQAAWNEYHSPFLQIEFLDTKPWYACIFPLDECITIGRSRENKVWIRDDWISRIHCKISLVNGCLYLQDLGTANGTSIRRGWFHKIALMPQQVEVLESEDRIIVGHYQMKIRIRYGYEAMG